MYQHVSCQPIGGQKEAVRRNRPSSVIHEFNDLKEKNYKLNPPTNYPAGVVHPAPVLQVCDGLCLNDFDTWILMDFGYLILEFLDFRCEKMKYI